MAQSSDLIHELELYRIAHPPLSPIELPQEAIAAWTHHDNMLEGRIFHPQEIQAAFQNNDAQYEAYLSPLLASIRAYREAIEYTWQQGTRVGPAALSINTLKHTHRLITRDPKDKGGQYRRTSPVHRDYYQRICAAERIAPSLKKLIEHIEQNFDQAFDPILFVADVHRQLMEIYPFRRNPGLVGRLWTNLLLLSRGYPPAILPGLKRRDYYDALCQPDAEALAVLYREGIRRFLERDFAF